MTKQPSNMKTVAQIVKCAKEAVREAGRSHLDDDARIPEDVFNRLADACDEWDNEVPTIAIEQDWWDWLNGRNEHANDIQDMEDTEAGFGADCKRAILRGCGR